MKTPDTITSGTDQLTDNEVIALFMSYFNWEDSTCGNYDKDRNRLMPVWYKFKGLKLEDREYLGHYFDIERAILHLGCSEACKLLAEGIRWYNSVKK